MEQKLEDILNIVQRTEQKVNTCFDEIRKVNNRITNLEKENTELKKQLLKLEDRVDQIENQSRRNNIIIYGVQEKQSENWEETENIVKDIFNKYFKLKIQNEIERAHRLGNNRNGKRPIIVKFNNFKTKDYVIKNSRELQGSKIAIAEDFSQRVRNERTILKPYLLSARQQGKKARLSFNKLVIENQRYSISDLQNIVMSNNDQTNGTTDNANKKIEDASAITKTQLRPRLQSKTK